MDSKIFYIDDDAVYFLACLNSECITERNKLLISNSPILELKGAKNSFVMTNGYNPRLEDLFKVSEVPFNDSNFGENVDMSYLNLYYLDKLIEEGIKLNIIKDRTPLDDALGFFLATGNKLYFVHDNGVVERITDNFGVYNSGFSFGAFKATEGIENIDDRLLLVHRASITDGYVQNQFPILIWDTKTMEPRVYSEEYVLNLEKRYKEGEPIE